MPVESVAFRPTNDTGGACFYVILRVVSRIHMCGTVVAPPEAAKVSRIESGCYSKIRTRVTGISPSVSANLRPGLSYSCGR